MSKKSHKQYHSRLFQLYIVLFIGFRKTVSHITVSLQTWELLMKFIRNNTTQMLQISELWHRDSVNTVIYLLFIYLFIYLLTKRYIHIAMYKESRTTRHR